MSTNKKHLKNKNLLNGVDLSPGKFISYDSDKKGKKLAFKIIKLSKKSVWLFNVETCDFGERTLGNLFDVEKNILNEHRTMICDTTMRDNIRKKLSEKRIELEKMEKLFAKAKKA